MTIFVLDILLLDISNLLSHENIVERRVASLSARILKDGFIKKAIAVDQSSFVVLDGHHRVEAARAIGLRRIPAIILDYSSEKIVVTPHSISKEDVIRAALEGRKFPPKTTKHMISLEGHLFHISRIEPDVRLDIRALR
ncbi:MAG: ParB N-terminal domain-containing protein [Candidatus Methanodesulfokora washburnensis]|uniref:Transcriptional regulator n=1 Tax=Candidatus Methanodesulfokora washburnensis TaxID=2478471 RepID=A0A3R9PDA6_9CREN|nr:ParB N-terminal domain-containing protein [Candidatus Methanodesulfokores washburnensis]RSN73234.1 transcriptional regulator [Candidatus Methanodesulfokores washburnensis]